MATKTPQKRAKPVKTTRVSTLTNSSGVGARACDRCGAKGKTLSSVKPTDLERGWYCWDCLEGRRPARISSTTRYVDADAGQAAEQSFGLFGSALLESISAEQHAERALQHAVAIHWLAGAAGGVEAIAALKQILLVLTGDRSSVDLDALREFQAFCERPAVPPPRTNPALLARLRNSQRSKRSKETKLRLLVRHVEQSSEQLRRQGRLRVEAQALLERLGQAFPGELKLEVPDVETALSRCRTREELQRLPPKQRDTKWTPTGAAAFLVQQAQARAWGYDVGSEPERAALVRDFDNASCAAADPPINRK